MFRATGVMLISLVTVLFISCRESNLTGSVGGVKETYPVTYNGNGNTDGKPPASQTKEKGVELTLSGNTGKLVMTGYTFTGWNTAADGSGTDYAAGASYTADVAVLLYAKWTPGSNRIVAGPKVTDADGNVYASVVIGTQIWTVDDLRTTKYNDGTAIPEPHWGIMTTGAYCKYNTATLYNWYAVNTGKLAPKGWRVPTDADWNTLQNYLIKNGYNWDGTTNGNKIAKSMAAKSDWVQSGQPGAIGNDLSKNNSCGFWARPCGSRIADGRYYRQNYNGYWWSATETDSLSALIRYLEYRDESLLRGSFGKSSGFSVRLVRD